MARRRNNAQSEPVQQQYQQEVSTTNIEITNTITGRVSSIDTPVVDLDNALLEYIVVNPSESMLPIFTNAEFSNERLDLVTQIINEYRGGMR